MHARSRAAALMRRPARSYSRGMALTPEWTRRIDAWRSEIRRHVYRPLDRVAFEVFATTEQLTADQAAKGKFAPMPPGRRRGAKWEYGWFRASVKVPKAAAGRRRGGVRS